MTAAHPPDREAISAAFGRLRAAREEVAALTFDALTPTERLTLLDELEAGRRCQPTVEHRLIHALIGDCTPADLGAYNWSAVLQLRLRISACEAHRRLEDAEFLGPRRALTGEPLEPQLPNVAKHQADGTLGSEHVRIIRKFFHDLPSAVDYQTREGCERTLADLGATHTPEVLRKAADRLAALVNPDGDFSDADRARKRGVVIGPQCSDGMSQIRGLLDPEARATLDAVLAKLAAPGMCNPEDESPQIDGEPNSESVERDSRTQAQRNHDALKAMGRSILCSGELGKRNGLPASIIVSTTLQDLQSAAGHAVTGGGSLLPMRDVIRLASHSHHYLVIFDKHTQEPLYLGRSKRLASAGQRIVLHAKDRGCTKPGCTVPGYGCQVHHAELDWAQGGLTDITDETFACPPHNRLVVEGGLAHSQAQGRRTEWIPPPRLDTDGGRVNKYHHPEELLIEGEDPDDP
jgi:Domain of unknown function (DUF222)